MANLVHASATTCAIENMAKSIPVYSHNNYSKPELVHNEIRETS